MDLTLDQVREVAQLLRETGVGEIKMEIKQPGRSAVRLKVARARFYAPEPEESWESQSHATGAAASGMGFGDDSPTVAPVVPAAPEPLVVTAAAVGVFKHCHPPLRPGDGVRTGEVIAIVESLKVPTEIRSLMDGQVVEVLVNEGDGVEYGQPLLRLKAPDPHQPSEATL